MCIPLFSTPFNRWRDCWVLLLPSHALVSDYSSLTYTSQLRGNMTLSIKLELHIKVKVSHTRYQALGQELMPVYRQSAPQVTISHPPDGRLPLLSTRPVVTFPAAEHHCPLAGTKLYCLVTEAHRCEQLAQGCCAALPRVGFEPTTCLSQVQCSPLCSTA